MMDTLEKIKRDALSDPLYFTKLMAKATTFGNTLSADCVDCGKYIPHIEQRDDTRCDDCDKAIGVME